MVWESPWRLPSSWRRSAYDKPDGLEFVGQKLEVIAEDEGPPRIPAPIPDYQLPIAGADHVKLATAAAGVVGTLRGLWRRARRWRGYCPGRSRSRHTPMRLDPLDRAESSPGPLHRLDARIKLIAALAFVVITVATPIGSWTLYGVAGFLAGATDWTFGYSAARSGTALADVPGLDRIPGTGDWVDTSGAGAVGLGVVAASILIKNSLAIVAMLLLAGVTSLHAILVAMRKLGVPLVLVGHTGVHGAVSLRARRRAQSHGDCAAGPDLQQAGHNFLEPGGGLDRAAFPAGVRARGAGARGDGRSRVAGHSSQPRGMKVLTAHDRTSTMTALPEQTPIRPSA